MYVREILKAWRLSIFLTYYVTALEKALVEINVIHTNVVERKPAINHVKKTAG